MSVSVALMGHPKRQPFIDELVPQLPGIEVVLDRHDDRWETGRRSLLAFDPAAKWHLTVQDDAILSRDLIPACEKVVEAAGERPVALYTGKVRPHHNTVQPAYRRARRTGSPWLEMEGPWWGVAIILPTAHIPDVVAWGDDHPEIQNFDRRIAAWYKHVAGIDCWYTVPSLVDHRPADDNPSMIPKRTGNRQAHWFIGEDRSGLEVDWSLPPVGLGDKQAVFRNEAGQRRRARVGTVRYRRLTQNPRWTEEVPNAPVRAAA